jgi:hypothetical protein
MVLPYRSRPFNSGRPPVETRRQIWIHGKGKHNILPKCRMWLDGAIAYPAGPVEAVLVSVKQCEICLSWTSRESSAFFPCLLFGRDATEMNTGLDCDMAEYVWLRERWKYAISLFGWEVLLLIPWCPPCPSGFTKQIVVLIKRRLNHT